MKKILLRGSNLSYMMKKVILITGATSGIGKQAAIELANKGHEIIILARNELKAENTRNEIISRTNNQNIQFFIADLSSFSSIRTSIFNIKNKYKKIDVLINNAGVLLSKRYLGEDGIELTFTTNHLGPFLLTNLLLDLIKKSDHGRIINVSSAAHRNAKFDFDDYNKHRKYSGLKVYGESKLCNLYFTYSLADKLKETTISVNALHPGFVSTNFSRNNGILFGIAMTILRPIQINKKKGAKTIIYLADSDDVENTTGKYFIKSREIKSSKISYNKEIRDRLWLLSEKLTENDL